MTAPFLERTRSRAVQPEPASWSHAVVAKNASASSHMLESGPLKRTTTAVGKLPKSAPSREDRPCGWSCMMHRNVEATLIHELAESERKSRTVE